jgi:dipeptidyl aminopeptidase/acylaminoacyl peptidase
MSHSISTSERLALPAVLLGVQVAAFFGLLGWVNEPFDFFSPDSWQTSVGLAYAASIVIGLVAVVLFLLTPSLAGMSLAVVSALVTIATVLTGVLPASAEESGGRTGGSTDEVDPPRLIAFQYARNGRDPAILVIDPAIRNQDCAELLQLSEVGVKAGQPSWLRDRSGVVYTRLLPEGRWSLEIQEVEWRGMELLPQGRKLDLLRDPAYHDVSPAGSPSIDLIALIRIPTSHPDPEVTNPGELWLYDRQSGTHRKLQDGPVVSPRWSSDGQNLVFTRYVSQEDGRVVPRVEHIEFDRSGEMVAESIPLQIVGEQLTSAAAVDIHEGAVSFVQGLPGRPSSIFFTPDMASIPAEVILDGDERPEDFHDSQPTMDPTTQRIAFVSTREAGDHEWTQQLWWASVRDGKFQGLSRLTDISKCSGSVQSPSW